MKKYIFRLISVLIVLLFALSANAQYGMSEAQLPFQSTSTMRMSGSQYSSAPVINEYGVAEYSGASYSPNKIGQRRSESSPSTPGPGKPENQQPIGDAPIALMLGLGVLYVLVMRKKERVED